MSRDRLSTQRRRSCIVVFLVGILAGCATTPHVTESARLQAQAVYERGVMHMNDREWPLALTALRQTAALDPGMALYRNALGIVYLQVGQPGLALAQFRRASEIDRDDAEAHLHAGIALSEMSRWAEAVEAYQRAIASPRLNSADTAHQNLGLALYHTGRYAEAEQALRFALSLDPSMEGGWYNLGLVLSETGRKDDARAAFRRARELAPNSPFGQAALERLKALGDGG